MGITDFQELDKCEDTLYYHLPNQIHSDVILIIDIKVNLQKKTCFHHILVFRFRLLSNTVRSGHEHIDSSVASRLNFLRLNHWKVCFFNSKMSLDTIITCIWTQRLFGIWMYMYVIFFHYQLCSHTIHTHLYYITIQTFPYCTCHKSGVIIHIQV